jgi:broad specificity phosphatase PhoE
VSPVLEELFAVGGEGARNPESNVVLVSHVSPIKAAIAWALGVDDLVAWRMRLSTGSVSRIAMGPQGPQLLSFNEVPYPD